MQLPSRNESMNHRAKGQAMAADRPIVRKDSVLRTKSAMTLSDEELIQLSKLIREMGFDPSHVLMEDVAKAKDINELVQLIAQRMKSGPPAPPAGPGRGSAGVSPGGLASALSSAFVDMWTHPAAMIGGGTAALDLLRRGVGAYQWFRGDIPTDPRIFRQAVSNYLRVSADNPTLAPTRAALSRLLELPDKQLHSVLTRLQGGSPRVTLYDVPRTTAVYENIVPRLLGSVADPKSALRLYSQFPIWTVQGQAIRPLSVADEFVNRLLGLLADPKALRPSPENRALIGVLQHLAGDPSHSDLVRNMLLADLNNPHTRQQVINMLESQSRNLDAVRGAQPMPPGEAAVLQHQYALDTYQRAVQQVNRPSISRADRYHLQIVPSRSQQGSPALTIIAEPSPEETHSLTREEVGRIAKEHGRIWRPGRFGLRRAPIRTDTVLERVASGSPLFREVSPSAQGNFLLRWLRGVGSLPSRLEGWPRRLAGTGGRVGFYGLMFGLPYLAALSRKSQEQRLSALLDRIRQSLKAQHAQGGP